MVCPAPMGNAMGAQTFLRWHACELDSERQNALFISEGCAHGFQTLSAGSELLYLHTTAYAPHAEGDVRYGEPRVAVARPLPVTDLSDRDRRHALLDDSFQGATL